MKTRNAQSALPVHADSEPRTLAERARSLIYEDIVNGNLPFGRKVQPDALKGRYDLGLSPIREALVRLSVEGIVTSEGQKGFMVPPVSVTEVRDIARIRVVLSSYALRESISRGDDAWEAGIVAAMHRLDRLANALKQDPDRYMHQWEERNLAFHAALESGVDSRLVLRLTAEVYALSERYRRQFVDYADLLPGAQDEHRALMDAALARDADAAVAILSEHILINMEKVAVRLEAFLSEERDADSPE
jgi:GntR family carbon starvation induced transcriptional regulator